MVEKICGTGEFWAWNETVNVWWRVRVVSRWKVNVFRSSYPIVSSFVFSNQSKNIVLGPPQPFFHWICPSDVVFGNEWCLLCSNCKSGGNIPSHVHICQPPFFGRNVIDKKTTRVIAWSFESTLYYFVHGRIVVALCIGYNYDSTSIRRPFDCLSKVIKVTVT